MSWTRHEDVDPLEPPWGAGEAGVCLGMASCLCLFISPNSSLPRGEARPLVLYFGRASLLCDVRRHRGAGEYIRVV